MKITRKRFKDFTEILDDVIKDINSRLELENKDLKLEAVIRKDGMSLYSYKGKYCMQSNWFATDGEAIEYLRGLKDAFYILKR